MISANLTLEQGRELMCIPGAINNVNTEGIYKLIKDGASIVTCGNDILNALNWEIQKTEPAQKIDLSLNPQEKIIFDIIGIEPKGFDEIQAETKLETDELLSLLTVMEMKSLVEHIDGDRYKRA